MTEVTLHAAQVTDVTNLHVITVGPVFAHGLIAVPSMFIRLFVTGWEKSQMLSSSWNISSMAARVALAAATLCVAAPSTYAAAITFTTTGSGTDGPLAASAMFTTDVGRIDIMLSNDLPANVIRSAGQALSDISFTLSNAPGTLGATSASGQLGNVAAGTPVLYVAGAPTRWFGVGGGTFSVNGSVVTLEAIGGGQPDQMIAPLIAQGSIYTNLNNGFANFNPYVIGPATFTLALSGVTAATTVTAVTFSFGTGPDTFLPGSTGGGVINPNQGPVVPEPASLILFGSGLIGAGVRRYRQRRSG